jgi:DNA-binding NtrC family response regulator
MEFIVRTLVELKLQVEELRRRTEQLAAAGAAAGVGTALGAQLGSSLASGQPQPALPAGGASVAIGAPTGAMVREGIAAPGAPPPPNVVTVQPGMTMAQIERAAIEAALRETRGNRRRAAEMLGIGERTLYRKLREYEIPEEEETAGSGIGGLGSGS